MLFTPKNRHPIRLFKLSVLSCLTAIALISTAVIYTEHQASGVNVERMLQIEGGLIAYGASRSLLEGNADSIKQLLGTVLSGQSNFRSACVYAQTGAPLACTKSQPGVRLPAYDEVLDAELQSQVLEYRKPILLNGKVLGSLNLRLNKRDIYTVMSERAAGIGMVSAVAIVLAIAFPIALAIAYSLLLARGLGQSVKHAFVKDSKDNDLLEVTTSQANAVQGRQKQILVNLSQEIRSPMNGILGMLTLARDTQLDEEQQELLDTAFDSGKSLLGIMNDILDLSKLEAGELKLQHIGFDVHILAEELVTEMAESTAARGIEVALLIDARVPQRVKGDPTRLRQVLSHLVSNAIRFTVQGEVMVRLQYCQENVLQFEVKDTGVGIAPERLENIFQSYSQVDVSQSGAFGAPGLGLSLCQNIVQLMGGEIAIESEPGDGSCFSFSVGVEAVSRANTLLMPDKNLETCNTLILCKNKTRNQVLTQYLESWNVPHKQVLEPVQLRTDQSEQDSPKEAYALAIIDVACTEDAVSIIEQVKALAEFEHTRFVALCAHSQSGDRTLLQNTGFSAFLSTPIRASKLRDCLLLVSNPPEKEIFVTTYTVDEARYNSERHVLVVEDNVVNQKVAQGILQKVGCHVEIANNGQDAVDVLQDRNFDLVFMDCQMPVLDGLEASRRIRQREKETGCSYQPIVAMTAHAMEEDRQASIDAGMDDHISKPVSKNDLESMLDIWGMSQQA